MRLDTFRRGSTAIEFALVLPLLLFFLSVIIDWGWFMSQRVTVARATMDGARVGATKFEPSTVTAGSLIEPRAEERAKDVLAGMGMPCDDPTVCVVTATYCANGAGGVCANPPIDSLVVQVSYAFTPFFGFSPMPSEIRDDFLMAVENQR